MILINYSFLADIQECGNSPSPCDPNYGSCDENPAGGYTCRCEEGYVLFTGDGTEGFELALTEDGLRKGDIYRIDHTCVRKN